MYKLGELSEMSFGINKLYELGEVSFGMLKCLFYLQFSLNYFTSPVSWNVVFIVTKKWSIFLLAYKGIKKKKRIWFSCEFPPHHPLRKASHNLCYQRITAQFIMAHELLWMTRWELEQEHNELLPMPHQWMNKE